MNEWHDIVDYRDFHDVPRIFLVQVNGKMLLFDCPFDDNLDDYEDAYKVYEMPEMPLPDDWRGLSRHALRCKGMVAVRSVTFDSTRRKHITAASLRELLN
jgi:hypothetical protein